MRAKNFNHIFKKRKNAKQSDMLQIGFFKKSEKKSQKYFWVLKNGQK
jgi:hypothetical protein